jgi:hypothetical protein
LRGVRFEAARLTGADFAHARLSGADFTGAYLERADLTGGLNLYGTSFLTATMPGADLTGAALMLADFTSANLQGAILSYTRLDGASLRDADLEGADLQQARLYMTDLSRAKVASADLRGVRVWRTPPPAADAPALADLSQLALKAPDSTDIDRLKEIVLQVGDARLRERLEEGLRPLLADRDGAAWSQSEEAQRWTALVAATATAAGDGYKSRLTEGLVRLACRAVNANGSVAVGVGRRALTPTFRGDLVQLVQGLRGDDCAAARGLPSKMLADLGAAADILRGQ